MKPSARGADAHIAPTTHTVSLLRVKTMAAAVCPQQAEPASPPPPGAPSLYRAFVAPPKADLGGRVGALAAAQLNSNELS